MTAETRIACPAEDLARPRDDVQSRIGLMQRMLRRALREPLLHFFLVGLILFVASEHYRAQTDLYQIVVTPERVRELSDRYRTDNGVAPAPARLARMVEDYIDQEVLYREGLARKLGRDDEIVRRRVVQKMQFLELDLAVPSEPNDKQLEAWYRAHQAQYAMPAAVNFSHIYFADGASGAEAARRRATIELAKLPDSMVRAPERGDPFPDSYDYSGIQPEQARLLFGDSGFSRLLFQAPPGRWVGPLRSSYGWHLLRVQSLEAAHPRPFSEVRVRVRDDLMSANQEAANRRRFAALKARFTVTREDGTPLP